MAYEHQIREDERPLARALWEQIFPEDSQAFLDAFCALKKDNLILGIHDADRLAAMIQLDRCRLAFGHFDAAIRAGNAAYADAATPSSVNIVCADYIVGVSTLPEFRHRGLMRTLLYEAMREGAARKDPFIFLMPANEPVYLPFDFRTVYLQTNLLAADAESLCSSPPIGAASRITGRVAGPEDCAALAEAASRVLTDENDTYLIRDERYFRDLITEMGAENGKVAGLYGASADDETTPAANGGSGGDACRGYLCYWPNEDGGALIRELVLPKAEREAFIRAHGLTPAPEQPKIMVRPLDPAEFVKPLSCPETRRFTVRYDDAILTAYSGGWTLTVGPEGGTLSRTDADTDAVNSHTAQSFTDAPLPHLELTPAALAEWVLGGKAPAGTEDIRRPDRILINEWI